MHFNEIDENLIIFVDGNLFKFDLKNIFKKDICRDCLKDDGECVIIKIKDGEIIDGEK